jgi:hypothetical protein
MAGRHRKQRKRKAPNWNRLRPKLMKAGGRLLTQLIIGLWL